MLNLSKGLVKREPVLVGEASRDDYLMAFRLRHRKNWRKLEPEQRRTILLAGAEQLETWALQMRCEAEEIVSR